MEAFQTSKSDLIIQIYQIIMIGSILKNWSHRYYNHYSIKFIDFIPMYYAINLNIVLFCMIFSILYLESIDVLQV